MLSEQQKEAIELLVNTDMKYGQIADKVGCHRNTLLQWRNSDEFKNEMDLVVQTRCKFLEDKIKLGTENLFDKMLVLIDKADSEHVKADLMKYLMDRALGKASSKLDVTIEPKTNELKDKEEFMSLLQDDNIIDVVAEE